MRTSARAVILRGEKVLTMFRRKIKDGEVSEYYVIPGGGVEEGETLEQTVKRELQEEMNVEVEVVAFLGKEESDKGVSNYFLCKIDDLAQPRLGGEEIDRMSEENYYEPRFVDIKEIDNIDLFGKEFVKKALTM